MRSNEWIDKIIDFSLNDSLLIVLVTKVKSTSMHL
jgi:hypothetical protein